MSATKVKERDIHNRISGIYDEFVLGFRSKASGSYQSYVDGKIVESLEIDRESTILEIGCGTGNLMAILSKWQSLLTVGLDTSRKMLEVAIGKVHKEKKHFIVADAEDLPFRELVFDKVVARSVLHHLHDPRRSLSEAHRILKHNGLVVVMEPNLNALMPIGRFVRYILKKSFFRDVVWSAEHQEFSVNQVRNLLLETMFRNINLFPIGFSVPLVCGVDWLINPRPTSNALKLLKFAYLVDEWLTKIALIQQASWHFIFKGRKDASVNQREFS